jgi:subtilase family serine protease
MTHFLKATTALAVGAAACLFVGATAPAAAAIPTLSGHLPAAVQRHSTPRLGAADPAMRLHLAIALPMHDQAGLDALLRDLYDPAGPNYKHYLTVAAFTERFGPAASDYATAVKFFADAGLRITGTAANRYLIDVEGSVADIERVLHITMGVYRHPTQARNFYAPDVEPTLDLAVPVLHITGLDNFVIPTPRLVRPSAKHPAARTTGSGPSGNFLGSDIRAAYYGGTSLTGAGQSIGLMELAGYNITDVTNYFTKYGPKLTAAINGISTDGSSLKCTGSCDDSEQVLDIEYAVSMAPGITQVQVYVADTAESVLNRMVSDNISKQLSTSWGWNESFTTDDNIFKEMAAQGQTMLTASGDDSSLSASGPWPEEDANLTAVGGTDLTTVSAGGAWKSETGWSGSAGGPSTDKTILIESYQKPFITTANGGSKTLRNVPDVAGDADTDNYICADGTCTGGYGGTSFASPIWAGFIALANQQAASLGKPSVGFLNPTLYALAGSTTYKTAIHDVTSGKSGKFSCTTSYDLVTGIGTPESTGLLNYLAP